MRAIDSLTDETSGNRSGRAAATGPSTPRTDLEALIARCAMGDRGAFESLYDATSGKLHAACCRILGRGQGAEDAMQDAYVKIWTHAGRYRVTGHSPMTWLITIARNTAIDRLRAQRRGGDVTEYHDIHPAAGSNPETRMLARAEAGRIRACLEELGADRRRAITGAYLDGLSYAELAERAGIPLNTMRTWLRRGLMALKDCVAR
nr:sigma-70 family RNA polymerase sigma factor [Cereibacter johrii]